MTRQFAVLTMSLHLQRAVFVDESVDAHNEDNRLGCPPGSLVQSPVRFVTLSPRSPARSPTPSSIHDNAIFSLSSSSPAGRLQFQSHGDLLPASKRRREELSADEEDATTVRHIEMHYII